MDKLEIKTLRKLLEEKFGVFLPDNILMKGMSSDKKREWLERGDRVTYLWTKDFLTTRGSKDPFVIHPKLMNLVTDTIKREGLKIYFGILSYQGRGDDALHTGFNVFELLKPYQKEWGFKFFMAYQGLKKTTLCTKVQEIGGTVFMNDKVELLNKNGEVVVPYNEPGKSANLVKSLKLIQREVEESRGSLEKSMVVFLDDDYVMNDALSNLMMIMPWVLSFVQESVTNEKRLQKVIKLCEGAGFVKKGSARLQFSRRVLREVMYGKKEVMNYRDFLIELLKGEIRNLGERFEQEEREKIVEKMIKELSQIKDAIRLLEQLPPEVVITPDNITSVLTYAGDKSKKCSNLIKNYLEKRIVLGGRVTTLLTTIFLRQSERTLFRWLSEFTYLLHGDQGAPLSHWLKMSFGRGYAIEISILVQLLLDKRFQNHKVINIIANPHIHQSQQDLNVAYMRDTILSTLDLLELLYGEASSLDFIKRYDIGNQPKRRRIVRHPDGNIGFDEQLLFIEKNPFIPHLDGLVLDEKELNEQG